MLASATGFSFGTNQGDASFRQRSLSPGASHEWIARCVHAAGHRNIQCFCGGQTFALNRDTLVSGKSFVVCGLHVPNEIETSNDTIEFGAVEFSFRYSDTGSPLSAEIDLLRQRESSFGSVEAAKFVSPVEVLDLDAEFRIRPGTSLSPAAKRSINAGASGAKARIAINRSSDCLFERKRSFTGDLSLSR